MTILVTGSTGTIGSLIMQRLVDQGASFHALAGDRAKYKGPAGVSSRCAATCRLAGFPSASEGRVLTPHDTAHLPTPL